MRPFATGMLSISLVFAASAAMTAADTKTGASRLSCSPSFRFW